MSVSQFVDEMQWENYNPISSYKWQREESGDPLKNLFPFGIPNGVTGGNAHYVCIKFDLILCYPWHNSIWLIQLWLWLWQVHPCGMANKQQRVSWCALHSFHEPQTGAEISKQKPLLAMMWGLPQCLVICVFQTRYETSLQLACG